VIPRKEGNTILGTGWMASGSRETLTEYRFLEVVCGVNETLR
jgi:hypothetical protein